MSPPAPPTPSRAELVTLFLRALGWRKWSDDHPQRKLVLNYLCHYCFVDTAKAFARDVPLKGWFDGEEDGRGPEGVRLGEEQVRGLEVRSAVRGHILSGEIPQAEQLITTHFPPVLSLSPAPLSSLPPRLPSPPPPPPLTPVQPEYPSSLTPSNMSMALSIQDWIEQIRTVPLAYPSPPPPSHSDPTPSPAPPSPDPPKKRDSVSLVETGQKLYARARALPVPHNDAFREEVLNISPLITWDPPEEKAPENVRHHLEWARRKGVATQINSAILSSQGFPPNAPLSSLIRQLTFIYQMLHELRIRPPSSGYPAGVEVLDPEDGDDLEWAAEAIPEFKLELYLSSERERGKGDEEDEDMDAEGEEDGEEVE